MKALFRAIVLIGVICTGTSGPAVARTDKTLSPPEIEQQLKSLGFDPGPVDGVYDAQTEKALRAFQRKAGVTETGIVDDATMAELIASTESKMLHSLPKDLLPAGKVPEPLTAPPPDGEAFTEIV